MCSQMVKEGGPILVHHLDLIIETKMLRALMKEDEENIFIEVLEVFDLENLNWRIQISFPFVKSRSKV